MNLFDIIENRPTWLKGAISKNESWFLDGIIKLRNAKNVLEVGVASGYSSAVILKSLSELNSHNDFELFSFDITENCYFDKTKKTGTFLYETFPTLIDHFNLKQMTTAEIKTAGIEKKIDVCFIDANHKHPYPVLDMLFTIDYMNPNGVYIFHDISLAKINDNFQNSNGPAILFNNLNGSKYLGIPNGKNIHSNIGAWIIPSNVPISSIKKKLCEIVQMHKFEQDLDDKYTNYYQEILSSKINISN